MLLIGQAFHKDYIPLNIVAASACFSLLVNPHLLYSVSFQMSYAAYTGIVVLFLANLFWGSVSIPFSEVCRILTGGEPEKATWGYIVLQSRLPQAVTALFTGASLAVAGLMLAGDVVRSLAGI